MKVGRNVNNHGAQKSFEIEFNGHTTLNINLCFNFMNSNRGIRASALGHSLPYLFVRFLSCTILFLACSDLPLCYYQL